MLNKLRDTPAVIVNDNVYRKYKIALVRLVGKTIPVSTMPASHPDVGIRVSDDEYFVTPKVLEVLQGDLEYLDIELVSNGLFVYGTLVKKGIYPDGQIFEGWGGLSKFPVVKAMIKDYALYYKTLPYAIRRDKQCILGEAYLGVDNDIIEYIHDVEIGAGYHETVTRAKIMENFPLIGDLEVRFYEYKGEPRGIEMRTMIYGEAFNVNRKMIYFKHTKYFSILEGNYPIIITAPHGGYYRPINMPTRNKKEADEETYELAREIITRIYELSEKQILPSAVLARIHRSRVDLNRKQDYHESQIAKKYHEKISKLINNQEAILIDIHGMSIQNDYDIELGTLSGQAIKNKEEVIENILSTLEKSGLSVQIDQKYSGGFTIRKHGAKRNVAAIQIEINKKLRRHNNYRKTARTIAEAILQSINL